MPKKTPERKARDRTDAQLAKAGWSLASRRVVEEFTVSPNALRERGEHYGTSNELSDYALLDRFERPIAIVEAKRATRDPIEAERQAADCADAIREHHGVDPFIFLANGDEIWFWHRKLYPPRKVSGFYTEEDLARLT